MNKLLSYARKASALLALAFLFVLVPVAVLAQTGDPLTREGLQFELLALAPVIIAVASLFLKEQTIGWVKRLVPAAIAVIVAVVFFIVEAAPEAGEVILVNISLLFTLLKGFYEPISSLVEMIRGAGRGLNSATPTGINILKAEDAG